MSLNLSTCTLKCVLSCFIYTYPFSFDVLLLQIGSTLVQTFVNLRPRELTRGTRNKYLTEAFLFSSIRPPIGQLHPFEDIYCWRYTS
jgi:hypothetical protein